MTNRLGSLLEPFSTGDLEGTIPASRQDIHRWRTGARVPSSGPNVRRIAGALVTLRTRDGIPTGDLAAVIREVSEAVNADRKARREQRR